MKFIDETARDDLAKSSTILQCILSILDFESNKFHCQPEVVDVSLETALVNCDPLNDVQLMEICKKVNSQFQRLDKKPTCVQHKFGDPFVVCEAVPLADYRQLT